MKKSSVVIVITIMIVAVIGILYINNSYNLHKSINDGSSKVENVNKDQESNEESDEITFGEHIYTISGYDIITARYLKSGGIVRIYSL